MMSSWQDTLASVADLAFETDCEGRLVFIAPDPALGWPAAALLGRPADDLLSPGADDYGIRPNPFRPTEPMRGARVWLRGADGSTACLSFAAAPLLNDAGHMAGARGLGFDVTEDERRQNTATLALRRLDVFDDIMWRLRQEVLPPPMIAAALSALAGGLRANGAAIVRTPIDLARGPAADAVRHHAGTDPSPILAAMPDLADRASAAPVAAQIHGVECLACPCPTRFRPPEALVLWRPIAAGCWTAEERKLVISSTSLIRIILEHEAIQQELSSRTRNDPLTGLFNRTAFLDELARRIERLEHENLPGTLLVVDVDDLDGLNERAGMEVGDTALCTVAALLHSTFRPADLLGRIGSDEFAIWLDGADDFAAAERAEVLRVDGASGLVRFAEPQGRALSISIAIGTRWPGQGEEIDMLVHRVEQLLGEITQTGGGQWRVSRDADN